MAQEVRLNGVRYRWPTRPVVVVCVDGGDPAYFDRALKDGIIPNVARFMKEWLQRARRLHHPELHLPEQCVDHHWLAAVDPWHLGQFLSRT